MSKKVCFFVNDKEVSLEISNEERLIDVLRERLYLTGTKEGCGIGECGACTVILEGLSVNACLISAISLQGKRITTIEGIAQNEELHPIQKALAEHNAIQCGFCTPGLVMSAKALLDKSPRPNREEIDRAIQGNLCRCTGYEQVVSAIMDVAKQGDESCR
ncbi:MAG: (2Fe-2S)-binding protein [Lachnospiraceae bacterium]